MASSPPASPLHKPQRPLSVVTARTQPRSNSRLSMNSKLGGDSRASDEDTRTAVRVAVRVRPPLNPGDQGYDLIPQRFQRSMVQVTSDTSLSIDSPHGRKLFVFDRVFGQEVMQDGIWDYLSDSVGAFTQGYNVSILAYGQSGAGKSFTMGTSSLNQQLDSENIGVIPRAAVALFEKLDAQTGGDVSVNNPRNSNSPRTPRGYGQQNILGDRNWSLMATYVEIYNEQLRDLLVSDSTPPNERNCVAIREDVKGNIILTGLRQVEINSVEDLLNALTFGSSIRQTDATAINDKSSRSHAVFSLNLVQRKSKFQGAEKRFSVPLEAMMDQDVSVTTDSKLHFVDLAGSERLKNTCAQGERAKEGISINAGLAALGKVISQLSSRSSGSHVSYRDSKLTRLLQDSLGGNAITYMIACVTPPEFHLSETLNTVQYAQRARAIQSKPRIQQIEEGDKSVVVDRLKAEVAFLREQIRSATGRVDSPHSANRSSERTERQNEREAELQNQLLDTQENYTALSQRHARLIAEMAKAQEIESERHRQLDDLQGESATDRLNRSNTFARAVEQVVLEYEKTIQTLEQSLLSTRTTLSNTETSLLEKETKCAYVETINSQLQSRLHKLMDREASTENYLHGLEAKLDGHTSGEENNSTIMMELRKEIARLRENEAACEDYISTLEERLAEADQDAELMQRAIDRLEQVIDRQRSLGKLETLLHELDHVDGTRFHDPADADMGVVEQRYVFDQFTEADEAPHVNEAVLDEMQSKLSTVNEKEEEVSNRESQPAHRVVASDTKNDDDVSRAQSPVRSKLVADRLVNVTQELVNLRVEHETTIIEHGLLHARYEMAMQKLAELQDTLDEAQHPSHVYGSIIASALQAETSPEPFRPERAADKVQDGPRFSAPRSLSSELSSAMDSPATTDTSNVDLDSEDDTATNPPAVTADALTKEQNEKLSSELRRLKRLAAEKETAEKELAVKYAQLESKHNETLDMVEELKTEVTRARAVDTPRVIRRKSSQNLMIIDRAHRSFASLRNIAAENFEGRPEVMQNFELNLNAAMHELYSRSERIQELESNVAATKKEMESKMAIISGLTRERSSLKTSPMDMSMVATLRDQLERSEKQLYNMRDAHAAREQELTAELEALHRSLELSPAKMTRSNQADEPEQPYDEKVVRLQAELAGWENKHKAALASMEKTEKEMQATIQQLEAQVGSASANCALKSGLGQDPAAVNAEARQQRELVEFLRGEIDEYKAIINSNASRVAEMESAHQTARAAMQDISKVHSSVTAETAARHQELASKLEELIAGHEDATKAHQEEMEALKKSHAKELAELRTHEQTDYERQVEVLMAEHSEAVQKLGMELQEFRDGLTKVAVQVAAALGSETSLEKLGERVECLIAGQKALEAERMKTGEMTAHFVELTSINESLARDLEVAKLAVSEMLSDNSDASAPLADRFSAAKTKMADLDSQNKKNSRLVEELEEQLQHSFDEVQVSNNRLSSLQAEHNSQLDEALAARAKLQAELDAFREEHAFLQAKYNEARANEEAKRSNSNSIIRKSASHASLPSPPPAIPLPPLPNGAGGGPSIGNRLPNSPTSTRPGSKDNVSISQVTDDQEARIRTIEKHLYAERHLTQTLEEALTDLEKQSKKARSDAEAWKKRAAELEAEVKELKQRPVEQAQDSRWSMHAVEEERKKRQAAEAARKQLEERMNAINKSKKKKGSLNCF